MAAILGVDVGGTFTDVALVADGGGVTVAKLPTTPDDQSQAVIEGIRVALGQAGLDAGSVSHLGHGTTAATNALIERRGARTALVTTRGFGDLLWLGRQARPHLYRPEVGPPDPLAALAVELDERMTPQGPLRRLDPASVQRAIRRLRRESVQAVAVCLLHSYADDRHERRAAELLRAGLGDVPVIASCELAPEIREFERASTTVADAYLGPVVGRYLRRLSSAAARAGLPPPLVMQSSGGLCSLDEAAAHVARLLLSGPAGGVAAVAATATGDTVSFDMGGTSTDVCLILGGVVQRTAERSVGGLPVRLPQVDVHTVGAGGGSIAWIDSGGALRVGPHSAGADPGPACYGRGGTLPTVTDANLLLGRLDPRRPLAGGLRLDRKAAQRAIAGVAKGFPSLRAAARGIVAVANQEMVAAIRVVTVERGHDPRDLELAAFGGAGPLHACDVADALGIRRVRVPAQGGVLSALGIAAGDRRRDAVRGIVAPLAGLTAGRLRALAPWPAGERGDTREAACDLRYRGQAFELTVPLEPARSLAARFHRAHEQRFGFADPAGDVELVAVRASRVAAGPALPRRHSTAGRHVVGPADVPMDGATLWVAQGWTARAGSDGGWALSR